MPGLAGGLLSGGLGIIASLIQNNADNEAYSRASNAANQAYYKPTGVQTPLSSVSATQNPGGGYSYNIDAGPYGDLLSQIGGSSAGTFGLGDALNSLGATGALAATSPDVYGAYQSALGQMGNIGNQFNGMAGLTGLQTAGMFGNTPLVNGGNALIGAGQNYLNNPVDPNAIANGMYSQLKALAQPGQTSQTQQLFNQLQATGRLGLTQNGELGDIGGLDLSQQLADQNLRLQAMQYGNNLSQQQAATGAGLIGAGAGALGTNTNNLATMLSGYGGLLNGALNSTGTRFNTAASALGLGQNLIGSEYGFGAQGINDLSTLQQAILAPFSQSIAASSAQGSANANAANIIAKAAGTKANNTAGMLGGIVSGFSSIF